MIKIKNAKSVTFSERTGALNVSKPPSSPAQIFSNTLTFLTKIFIKQETVRIHVIIQNIYPNFCLSLILYSYLFCRAENYK